MLTTCFLIACSISMVTGNRCKSTTWKQTQYGTELEELGKMICSFLVLTSSHMSSNIDHMLIYVFGGQFGAPTECHMAATVTFVRLRNLRILDCYPRLQQGVSAKWLRTYLSYGCMACFHPSKVILPRPHTPFMIEMIIQVSSLQNMMAVFMYKHPGLNL